MQYSLPQAFNHSEIEADAKRHPNLRLFTVDVASSNTPALDVNVATPYVWSRASASAVTGPHFHWFSAVCYLFGRDLHVSMASRVPIGLVAASVGGTHIRSWESSEALEACQSG